MFKINNEYIPQSNNFGQINRVKNTKYIAKSSENIDSDLFAAIKTELKNFINGIQDKIEQLSKESFDNRSEMLMLITNYKNELDNWLSSHTSEDKFNLLTDIEGLKDFIVNANIEILGIYVNGEWLLSEDELKELNIEQLNDIGDGINGFSISALQSSPLQSLELQGQLQAISRTYTLWTQLQVIMNDILKTIIQGIR